MEDFKVTNDSIPANYSAPKPKEKPTSKEQADAALREALKMAPEAILLGLFPGLGSIEGAVAGARAALEESTLEKYGLLRLEKPEIIKEKDKKLFEEACNKIAEETSRKIAEDALNDLMKRMAKSLRNYRIKGPVADSVTEKKPEQKTE